MVDSRRIRTYKEGQDTRFSYQEVSKHGTFALGDDCERVFESNGLVPAEVCNQGEKAVRQYAKEVIGRDMARQHLEAEWQDSFAAEADFLVMAQAGDGTLLRGRILLIKNAEMEICLEGRPYGGKLTHTYSAPTSSDLFQEGMTGFSKKVIVYAQEALVQIYGVTKEIDRIAKETLYGP